MDQRRELEFNLDRLEALTNKQLDEWERWVWRFCILLMFGIGIFLLGMPRMDVTFFLLGLMGFMILLMRLFIYRDQRWLAKKRARQREREGQTE